jgi:hypothetical protein
LPASRRTTVAAVAAVAGVGDGTVSRVLNGGPLRQQLALEVVPRASSARRQGPGPYSPDTDIGIRPDAATTRRGSQSPPTNTHGVT